MAKAYGDATVMLRHDEITLEEWQKKNRPKAVSLI